MGHNIIISLYVVMVKLQCIFIKLKVMHHYLMTPFCFDTTVKNAEELFLCILESPLGLLGSADISRRVHK